MVRSDRTFPYPVPRDRLWDVITRTSEYRSWWPWLRRFEGAFVAGDVWRCKVQPPLPWTLRFTITLDEVVVGERAAATVDGDIRGTAELTVAGDATSSSVRLVSDLAPASPVLQTAALAARPLVVWGHDWILDRGAAQFRERALSDGAG